MAPRSGLFAVRMEERHIAIGHCRYTTPILVYSNIITASSLQYVCEAVRDGMEFIQQQYALVLDVDGVVLVAVEMDSDSTVARLVLNTWTLLHYQICSYVTDAEIYTVPKQVKILLQSIAGKNVKKTDAILDVPVLKQRLLETDRQKLLDKEIIEYLLGISNNAFTLSELEVWMQRATKKYNDNYGWWK